MAARACGIHPATLAWLETAGLGQCPVRTLHDDGWPFVLFALVWMRVDRGARVKTQGGVGQSNACV